MSNHYDVVVVGAGMAGLSVAGELAGSCSVAVIERESQPCYHATGRSAAVISDIYGQESIRALTRASRPFFERPPVGLTDRSLLESCGWLYIARADQLEQVEKIWAPRDVQATARRLSAAQAREMCPVLREDHVAAAIYDPTTAQIDVHAVAQCYTRMLRRAGGSVILNADVSQIQHDGRAWMITTSQGIFRATVLVNAAGAWADEIARRAGVAPMGVQPCQRTALVVDVGPGSALSHSPIVVDVDEQFYFRPESGGVFISPADETPVPPCDSQPEELDVALAIERVTAATTFDVRRIRSKWAGLRSFVADRAPVAGFDERLNGVRFFWLAGQGGSGIQTAPALARFSAALILQREVPRDLIEAGVAPSALAPQRIARTAS
jgi:D-arginine dehydrogenase